MKIFAQFLFLFALISPFSNMQAQTTKLSEKETLKLENYALNKERLESQEFFFNGEWMQPRNGIRMNMVGNPGYVRMHDGNLDIYLPYIGIVRTSNAYNASATIIYEGEPRSYEIKHNEDTLQSELSFSGKFKGERFDFTMTVYSTGNATLWVRSGRRDGIRYDGEFKNYPLESEK